MEFWNEHNAEQQKHHHFGGAKVNQKLGPSIFESEGFNPSLPPHNHAESSVIATLFFPPSGGGGQRRKSQQSLRQSGHMERDHVEEFWDDLDFKNLSIYLIRYCFCPHAV